MRFLTRAWHEQQLTTEELERIDVALVAHLDVVGPQLPEGVATLAEAGGEQSLHDGRVASASFEGDRLTLVIRGYDWSTDLPVAPRELVIRYDRAAPMHGSAEGLLATLCDAECEILYCEFDLLGEGRFEHRMLLWPPRLGEVAIGFGDAIVELGPPGSRDDDWDD